MPHFFPAVAGLLRFCVLSLDLVFVVVVVVLPLQKENKIRIVCLINVKHIDL